MFKGRAGDIVVLGLSHENIRRLIQNDPIVFDLDELRLPSHKICISCQQEGRAAFPKRFSGSGIALSKELLMQLKKRLCVHTVQLGTIQLTIFAGKNERTIERELKQFLTADSQVIRSGFPPGYFTEDN